MRKTLLTAIALLTFGIWLFAQDTAYYKAIQKKSSTQIAPDQFKNIEETALKDFSKPETYELLASSFGNTTEKVWAVVYGEAYCNLSSDDEKIGQMGSQIYQWYAKSLSKNGDQLSIDLTENAQGSGKQPPFESQYEITFLMGAISVRPDPAKLSIRQLTEIRKNQLALWRDKKLPKTELIRRQEEILGAGHFDAYSHWLFQKAQPEEFAQWLGSHQQQFQAWQDWNNKNKFAPKSPDFQRLHMVRG